ncbi:MAG TPA: rhodanese-like domain-containing protein, partial [Candidatus Limnocylindrales bacterium]|nr:rhodanese-like domain-containing protein [Candidatus Limnocylindrales bacterium]
PLRETAEEATTQLLRIGYERVLGTLAGGVEAWQADGREISSYEVTTMAEVNAEAASSGPASQTGETLLDVRQPIEWQDDGAIPGSQRIFVADLPARLAEIPAGERVTVLCKSGARAAIAASLLDAAGRNVRLVVRGGAASWAGTFEHPATDAVG